MMKKNKTRIIGIVAISLLLSIPLVIFTFLDYQNIDKQVAWQNSSLDKQLMEKYPIINDIYNEFFTNHSLDDINNTYVVRKKDDYPVDKQQKMEELQKLYTQEVNLLLEKQVIDHELLELAPQEQFKVDFGTIYDKSVDNKGTYNLDILYRFNSDYDNWMNFEMNTSGKKITSLSITNQLVPKLTKDDLKKMAWQMIEYLGLNEIDDWVYNEYGYESYQAKLQVTCEISEYANYNDLNIRVAMLGSNLGLITH